MATQIVSSGSRLSSEWEDFFRKKFLGADGLRKKAFEYLCERGLPQRGAENWRYTSFKIQEQPDSSSPASGMLLETASRGAGPEMRRLDWASDLAEFKGLHQKWNDVFHNFKRKQRRVMAPPRDLEIFTDGTDAFHEAFVEELLLVRSKGSLNDLEINFRDVPGASQGALLFPRILIEVQPSHHLTLTTSCLSQQSSIHSKIQILLREGARLDWVFLQNSSLNVSHVEQIEIICESKAQGHALFVGAGSARSRQNIRLTFADQKATFKIHGLCLANKEQHFDTSTVIEHLKGENFSEQLFKSVLGGQAKSIFSGLVYIEKGAQLAHSSQLNKSLILNRGAEAISQPQLEIYADDVKATHGSTVGQIQPEELFYLKSRAISEPEAISMLCEGFASELLFELSNLRQRQLLADFLKSRIRELRG